MVRRWRPARDRPVHPPAQASSPANGPRRRPRGIGVRAEGGRVLPAKAGSASAPIAYWRGFGRQPLPIRISRSRIRWTLPTALASAPIGHFPPPLSGTRAPCRLQAVLARSPHLARASGQGGRKRPEYAGFSACWPETPVTSGRATGHCFHEKSHFAVSDPFADGQASLSRPSVPILGRKLLDAPEAAPAPRAPLFWALQSGIRADSVIYGRRVASLCPIRISRSRIRWTLPTPLASAPIGHFPPPLSGTRAPCGLQAVLARSPHLARASGQGGRKRPEYAGFSACWPEAPAPSGCAMSRSCEIGKDG